MSSAPDERRYAVEPSFVDDVTSEIPIGTDPGVGHSVEPRHSEEQRPPEEPRQSEEPRHSDDWGRSHGWVPSAQLALERFETTPTVAEQPVGELHSTEWLAGPGGPTEDVAQHPDPPTEAESVPFLTGEVAPRASRTPPTPFSRSPAPAPAPAPVEPRHPGTRFATAEDRFVTRPHAGAVYLTNSHPDAVPTTPTGFRGVDIGGDQGVEEPTGASAVRPYMWTRGRTRSGLDLAIEALVSTSMQGRNQIGLLQVEHRTVAELCEQVRSVAEVAALLSLPLGVARVLLGDMAGLGVITVHQTASSSGSSPDLALMERVLSGLRRL
jgi:hypothetical protein